MDHREIGQQLDLFMFSPLSPGNPIWLNNGVTVYNILIDKIRQLNKGYIEVRTPILWKSELYEISGHMEHYAKNMFFTEDVNGNEYALKPMNCPGHMMIFKSKQWSYRDLPVRISDFGVLHREEVSGAIGGLTRCRSFCQDDGHIFLANTSNEINKEVVSIIDMIQRVYGVFNMPLRVVLSTKPESSMGSAEEWVSAEAALFSAIAQSGLSHSNDEGGGAFYGPKIDFFVKDSQGREWQTATIQLDFQLPQKFELKYVGENGNEHQPVVIHRAIYGSFERFIGIILEHYQGVLPYWLAPVQVVILPVGEKHQDHCRKIHQQMLAMGVRAELFSDGTLPNRIRLIEGRKVPYIFVAGDKEVAAGSNMVDIRFNRDRIGLCPFDSVLVKSVNLF